MVKSSAKAEIRPLTGIRGFAAGLVLLIHFFPLWAGLLPGLHIFDRLAGRGYVGVDLFFILSGFILNYVYFDAGKSGPDWADYRSFVWHRFIRVWPVHFAGLLLMLGLVLAAGMVHWPVTGNYAWEALPFQLTMTHAWPLPGTGWSADPLAAYSWNYPSWSVSAEWFAYLLVFPLAWRLLRGLDRAGETVAAVLAGLVIAGWAGLLEPCPVPVFGMTSRVTVEFVTGALLYRVFSTEGMITRGCQRAAGGIFLVVLLCLLFAPVGATKWIVVLFPALLLGLTAEQALVARFFTLRPVLWLGRISYSIYMTQAIVQRLLKAALNPARFEPSPFMVRLLLCLGVLGLVLGMASLFYYLVETPARAGLRRWAERCAGPPPPDRAIN
jgi:peptidoglycan/LPS O-acetylase OafA/YrhL